MDIIINDFKQDDSPFLLEIYNHIVTSTKAIYRETPFSPQEWEQWVQTRLAHHFPIIVARDEATMHPIGFGSYHLFRAAQGYRYSYEHSLHVSEAARKKGVGARIMQAIIERAKQQNGHLLIGVIDSENQESIRFHQKFGFAISGTIPEVAQLHNEWREVVFMHKILE